MNNNYSDYIVYVDESGDHGLSNLDPNYPVFVLAFCIFHKRYYCETAAPRLQKFKFKHFGHDLVILHEREIRKEEEPFNIFRSKDERLSFMQELSNIIEDTNFVLTACVIQKNLFRQQLSPDENPYHIALGFLLERLYAFLEEKGQQDRKTHVVVEARGKKEDNELELEFRRICDGDNNLRKNLPFDVKFASKQSNSSGLQLADLVARPIGMHVLRPEQENRAFDILIDKFFCDGGRENTGQGYEEKGLKRFP